MRKANLTISIGESVSIMTPTAYIRIIVSMQGHAIVHVLDGDKWVPLVPPIGY